MKRLNTLELLALNAYWVGLAFMWNSLHPLILPAVLIGLVPDEQKNTYLGVLTFAGLLIATLVQPLAGALSDAWPSRWGRRRPFIALGTLVDFAFLGLMAAGGGLPGLVIGYLGLQLSSNVAHGPMQGLMPDRVPAGQLGAASGLKILLDTLGLILGLQLTSQLMERQNGDPTLSYLAIAALVALTAAMTLRGAPEAPSAGGPRPSLRAALGQVFKLDGRTHRDYWWLIAGRFAFLIGISGVQAFAQYYIRDVLAAPDPVRETANLGTALTISLMACAIASGWLCDRVGARPVMVAAGLISAGGYLLLPLARDSTMLVLYGSVLGGGVGLFLTANWMLANRLAAGPEAGKLLGLTNLATAGANALSRLEGPAIDALNGLQPGLFAGYLALFGVSALFALASVLALQRVGQPAPAAASAGQ